MSSLDLLRNNAATHFGSALFKMSVFNFLKRISDGQLLIVDGSDERKFGSKGMRVSLIIHDKRAYSKLLLGGPIGAAEAYMLGYWSTDNLTGLIRIFLRNRKELEDFNTKASMIKRPLHSLFHRMHRDTLSQSKENISAHYDLGNDFFQLFLDPSLTYSSGYFCDFRDTMEEASFQKVDRICRKLELKPEDEVLEIGTGWGSFALHAATHYGCKITTTTISDEQYEHVVKAVRDRSLEQQVTVLKKDYRSIKGQYGKIVSIEMIEAVGLEYMPTFFRACSQLLKPGGSMLIQAITISEDRFESAKNSVDFIQRYIFPGGALPSVELLMGESQQANLRPFGVEDMTQHYAETMLRWRLKFEENLNEIKDLGRGDTFLRMWDYYLCYCEGGFLESAIGCVHMQFQKTESGRELA
ncbi:MAG: class I SAM-dependent methyltransferase [Gammaproteobacteria bacterium]|jgi:cyclopropane-fatty-acyl-phospholipid synthase|nr:class I SAM-dependent methyltransferase [Gammaproteobacteria bacterium]MBT5196924.1 class I SAM-dependent methyltransferase [Gammaproteobacteria bacterium]MBT6570142.1 class I SAM-dependent methyltransferase [Gammaproteobacteria bacterium]MBT7531102.1 class I SAM-dependent methyltransferase [Gammaproteobacteria bacterium]MBT7795317.1 class I SAM-dependent methyltransferase [Gammaproteobacteria bacterium]